MYRIIKQYDDFIIIDKRPNVGFHREKNIPGLVEILKSDLKLDEIYPIHRLDKMTSGIILFALNKAVSKKLSSLFQKRLIEKYYLAISDKRPGKKQGLIKGDMSRSRRGTWKLNHSNLHPAITQFFSFSVDNNLRLFILKPLTGKTHQIRVALKSMGSPIAGDEIYGNKKSAESFDRGYLHACAVRFSLKNQNFEFFEFPQEGICFKNKKIVELINNYQQPWNLPWPVIK